MPYTRHFFPVVAFALTLSAGLFAQERRQGGGGNGLPPYNASAEITVSGTITGTENLPTMSGDEMLGVTLTVDGQPLHVILGPAAYVKKQSFTFTANAKADVTGMPGLRVQSEPAMIARQVKVGSRTLTLRDATGKPAWESGVQR